MTAKSLKKMLSSYRVMMKRPKREKKILKILRMLAGILKILMDRMMKLFLLQISSSQVRRPLKNLERRLMKQTTQIDMQNLQRSSTRSPLLIP